MSADKIADKIRRLLALAESDNEHEAASAAARAQELILKHNVSEEEIRAAGGDIAVEPITQGPVAEYRSTKKTSWGKEYKSRGKVPVWHTNLAGAMAPSFMVKIYYYSGKSIYVVGRASNREAFGVTWTFVRDQIQRLCDEAWERAKATGANVDAYGNATHGTAWKRGFCFGAVTTIRERMRKADRDLTAGPTAPAHVSAASQAPTAAIVLASRQAEVEVWIKKNLKLGSGRSTSAPVPGSGFTQGKAAGWTVDVSTRATKKLGQG